MSKTTRTAVVTGGTRGIGAAISKELKKTGHEVVAVYYGNDVAAQEFHKETGIRVYKFDVSSFEACQENIEKIKADLGTNIDILVNNAGITRDGFLHKMTFDMWQEVISTNLNSCFNMIRCVIQSMREQGYGRIINISSINGQKGQAGQCNYSAAKAGVIGLTKSLALECASKGITVNAIAPGYIDTDMVKNVPENVLNKIIEQVPAGRLGMADEVARAVIFLADDEAGYITGTTLSLNGGQYLH